MTNEQQNPGDYRVQIGRWATMAPGGLKIKDMMPGDVYWLAKQCTGSDEARNAAEAYMKQEPEKFQGVNPNRTRRYKKKRFG